MPAELTAELTAGPAPALGAGPELDRLVALALGWTPVGGSPCLFTDGAGLAWCVGEGSLRQPPFRPSEYWSGAGLVIEAMGLLVMPALGRWQAWAVVEGEVEGVSAEAATPQLAVCRCAAEVGRRKAQSDALPTTTHGS